MTGCVFFPVVPSGLIVRKNWSSMGSRPWLHPVATSWLEMVPERDTNVARLSESYRAIARGLSTRRVELRKPRLLNSNRF